METVDVQMIDRVPATASSWALTFGGVSFAGKVQPGQFVMLRIPGRTDPLLARPYSVYDAEGDTLRLLVKVVGKGSALLAGLEPGSPVQLTGPLGNSFRVKRSGPILMLAGGCGAAPFLLLARRYACRPKQLIFGAATGTECVPADPFRAFGVDVHYMTEDGSLGARGLVTAPFEKALDAAADNVTVLACGPTPMLRAVSRIAAERGVAVQLSLEARMACGIGVCQGCAVKVRYRDEFRYKLVCKDGPVFDASDLFFDETPGSNNSVSACKGR